MGSVTLNVRVAPNGKDTVAIDTEDGSYSPFKEIKTGKWLSASETGDWSQVQLVVATPDREFKQGDVIRFTDAGLKGVKDKRYLTSNTGNLAVRMGEVWYSPETVSSFGSDNTVRQFEHEYLFNIITDDLVSDEDDTW